MVSVSEKNIKKIWMTTSLFWTVWWERNRAVFKDIEPSPENEKIFSICSLVLVKKYS